MSSVAARDAGFLRFSMISLQIICGLEGVFEDGSGPPSNVGEHCDQGVGRRLEAPRLDRRGTVGCENLQLLFGIGAQVGLGALDTGVAEP